MLTLDTVLDLDRLFKINDDGFSRIPISFANDKNIICGVLLAKSLVGYVVKGQTIRQAIVSGEIDVRVPVYLTKSASMVEALKVLSSGISNMGMIYGDSDMTGELRDFADKVM